MLYDVLPTLGVPKLRIANLHLFFYLMSIYRERTSNCKLLADI